MTETQLDDRPGDFPRINMRPLGLANRYGYVAHGRRGTATTCGSTPWSSTTSRPAPPTVHDYGPEAEAGEAVFAPDPDGTAEDDGWLLNFVFDRATEASDAVILDARDVTAEPVARVHLPRRVPFGFHGSWLPTIS